VRKVTILRYVVIDSVVKRGPWCQIARYLAVLTRKNLDSGKISDARLAKTRGFFDAIGTLLRPPGVNMSCHKGLTFDEMVARVDHTISDKDHLTGRYFFDRFNNAAFLHLTNYLNNSSFSTIDSHVNYLNPAACALPPVGT
jgi:hypothetical protein